MDPRIDALSRRHRWHLFRQYKCMSDELMDVDAVTSPPVTVRNLAVPRLRKCPFDIDTIDWRRARKLGQGADGCVYRVCFGDRGPFALKLFWIPDPILKIPMYSPVHRECQNAALLQMLRAAVDKTTSTAYTDADTDTDGALGPPLVHPNPMDFFTASDNLFAFSDEIRRSYQEEKKKEKNKEKEEEELVPVTTMPRFAKCYGWLPCNVHELMQKMPRHMRMRGFRVDRKTYRSFDPSRTDFIGIVYEYIRSDDCSDDGSYDADGGVNAGDGTTKNKNEDKEKQVATGDEGPPTAALPQSEIEMAATTTVQRYNTRARTRQMANEAKEEKAEADATEKEHNGDSRNAVPLATNTANTANTGAQDTTIKNAKDAVHRERVSAAADFLWLAGFEFCIQPLACNWKNGVLVDHSEIIGPYSSGWQRTPRDTKWSIDWLLTPSGPPC